MANDSSKELSQEQKDISNEQRAVSQERENKLRKSTEGRTQYDDGGNRITKREWVTGEDGKETYTEKNIHGDIVKEEKHENNKVSKDKENPEKSNGKESKKKQDKINKNKKKKDDIKKAKKTQGKIKGVLRTLSVIKTIIIFLITHIWFTLTIGIFTMLLMFGVLAAIGQTTGEYSEEYVVSDKSSSGTGTVPYIDGKYKVNIPIKESTSITSKYGWRNIDGWVNFHNGVDFSVQRTSPGTNVYAAIPGKVVKVIEWSNPPSSISSGGNIKLRGEASKGQYIVIEHNVENFKLYTIYMHMYRINVSVGDNVGNNDVIGIAGNTGASTGPHLHFEIRKGSQSGITLNPENYIYYGD